MRLVVVPLALVELNDAAAFYTARANVELGLVLVAEFERTATPVLDNPMLGAVFRGTRRRYSLRRFPDSIIYQVTPEALRVIAFAHHRRRPSPHSSLKGTRRKAAHSLTRATKERTT